MPAGWIVRAAYARWNSGEVLLLGRLRLVSPADYIVWLRTRERLQVQPRNNASSPLP